MNHGYPPPRAMVPQGGPSQRLNELLDNIRTEFETESQRSVDYEGQSKSRVPVVRAVHALASACLAAIEQRRRDARC